MLQFNEVNKVFKSDLFKEPFRALDNLSFHVKAGEIVGFLGANGAGKTTSIKIAMDFIRATSGVVKFDDKLGHGIQRFSKIGYLPERPFFYPNLTGREFAEYMGSLAGISRKKLRQEIPKWGEKFKISFALDRQINTYSKGMLQRLGFMCTLLHTPSLIILDEPLSGLDPIGRKDLKDIIVDLNKMGATIFFSSHIVSDVEEICSSVIFLQNGKKIYEGSVDKIIAENLKPNVHIHYYNGNDRESITVASAESNQEIKNLINKGAIISSVTPERPSLESIFYSVK